MLLSYYDFYVVNMQYKKYLYCILCCIFSFITKTYFNIYPVPLNFGFGFLPF